MRSLLFAVVFALATALIGCASPLGPDAGPDGPDAGGPDCAALAQEAEDIAATTACVDDEDCQLVTGDTSCQLPGCTVAVNQTVAATALSDAVDAWAGAGCRDPSAPVCDCASPTGATCEDDVCVTVP